MHCTTKYKPDINNNMSI